MKRDFHLHFYTRIFFSVAVLAMVLFLSQRSVQTNAVIITDPPTPLPLPIRGLAYSPITGWISLNCKNDFNGDGILEDTCTPQNGNYGLQVINDSDVNNPNKIVGCAWSGQTVGIGPNNNLGWICFSDPDPAHTIFPTQPWSLAPDVGVDVSPNHNLIVGNDMASIRKIDIYSPTVSGYTVNTYPGEDVSNFPRVGNPIEGCFNCHTTDIKECKISHIPCTSSVLDCQCLDENCSGNGPACVKVGQINSCDNCLQYSYYKGKCSTIGLACDRNSDCTLVGDTCAPISTCDNPDRGIICDPVTNPCAGGEACVERTIGSIKNSIGASQCTSCSFQNIDNTCDLNAYGYNKNSCESCQISFYNPGLILDSQYGRATSSAKLCGWGLNNEIGWIWFSPKIATSSKPYISVEGGSIYSGGNIFSRYAPPVGRYNASYLIESSGNITNFVSSSTLSGLTQGEWRYRPSIDYFRLNTQDKKYRNVLGSIDYTGIVTTDASHYNKYGSLVTLVRENFPAFAAMISSQAYLDGKTFYFPEAGSVAMGDGVNNMNVRTQRGKLASGIMVIEGNLRLSSNVVYQDLSLTGQNIENLIEIPSLIWIVKGDLTIEPQVTRLAGTFIVLGNDDPTLSCAGDTPDVGCGQFISCDPSKGACDRQLVVDGGVLAKRFKLLRTYYDVNTGAPAELFINNGRLQTNPPPGLVDFGQLMPRFIER